ncbi:MAG: iron-sulfur cluster assembly accessory protein [Zetaproteobacteria bacterium]|nr:MAG: iron-sulfur cluster assembly accessory protein [Zetaproteobacteria bacterium]
MDVDIVLTDSARLRMKELLKQRHCAGLRLALRQAGCSGYEYVLDYVEQPDPADLKLDLEPGCLYIDRASYDLGLKGIRIDFQQDLLSSSFVYHNPNVQGECGCGASVSFG